MNLKLQLLLNNLKKLSPASNQIYIIHNSLWLASPAMGDLPWLFNELKLILGNNSTLCFPSFTFSNNEKKNPVWNEKLTPGKTGILSEYVRKEVGGNRTIHPTHSFVLVGDYSNDIAANIGKTAFGADSTLNALVELGAFNISFGPGIIGGHSFLHVAEELGNVPYRSYTKIGTPCILNNGKVYNEGFDYYGRNLCINGVYHENDWDFAWIDFQERQLIDYIDSDFGMVTLSNCKKVLNYMKNKIEFEPYFYAKKCKHNKI